MPGNDLYIPIDDSADGGTERPYPTDRATKPWENANIRIQPEGGTESTSAHAGRKNTVIVRVKNKGQEVMTGVQAQAWVFDPGIGEMTKENAYDWFDNAGNAQTIKPGEKATFRMTPWNAPSFGDGVTEKHFCLRANTYQVDGEGERVTRTAGTLKPDTDAHQGQCNITLVTAPQGQGTSQKVPTTTFPPPGGDPVYMLRADHVTTKPDVGELAVLKAHGGIVPNGGETSVGGLSLMTSRGPVPITLSSVAPGFDVRSEFIPGFDTPFTFAEGRPDKIPTDIVVHIPEDAAIGSLHVFDVGLWTERGDMVGSGLRVLTLVTE
ncbi:hypothetical protein EES41_35510 [Streptomyces sp. ADI95-16]|uniref:hypothetical protein n=1 Tax=Streptomyces sp. ADI95-16 TaxID=1522758 RepID=UPI000F3AA39E|nr:hypothetical protein [Streptomyces sp. ADI95-16]AYV32063.1 hypothetical protein EES41_35510 [Streptomyces sp. ADI95-16]